MVISMDQVKELRELTGISVMQCRKALEEAGGDKEKALIILRKKGGDAAQKKSDRTLGSGVVQSYIHSNGAIGSLVELACETDFVSKNPEFKTLAYEIAMQVAASKPEFVKTTDIPVDAREKAKEVFKKDIEGKPAAMKEKILEGKLAAFFNERVLLNQPYIKNPEITVEALIQAGIQKFGEKIEVIRFVRFAL
jgi:elongation factor Ts